VLDWQQQTLDDGVDATNDLEDNEGDAAYAHAHTRNAEEAAQHALGTFDARCANLHKASLACLETLQDAARDAQDAD